jgi:anti-sigma factor RsiW
MTAEEARDRFSQAVDGELSDDERRAFDAVLAEDAELAAEFERFAATVRETRAMGSTPPPRVDLVPGVQRKLRTRSRGRYYRDRFAARPAGRAWVPLTVAALTLALLVGAWLVTWWLLP